MHVRIVTFQLDGPDEESYRRAAAPAATAIAGWPGLHAKLWLADRATGTYGGLYLFDSQASADRSRSTQVFHGMAANPAFADLAVREFGVLDDLTQVTSAGLPGALAAR